MKFKTALIPSLCLLALIGCNKEEISTVSERDGCGYLSVSLVNQTTDSRGNTIDKGTEEESTVSSVTIVCYDGMNTKVDVVDFKAITNGVSSAKAVDKRTKKIGVITNYDASTWDLDLINATYIYWDDLRKAAKEVEISQMATPSKFIMVNEGVLNANGLCEVVLRATPEEALSHPAEITVERLAAKVTMTQKPTLTIKPTGAKFLFQGWELNTVARRTRLYPDVITYPEMSTTTKPAYYRIDDTYYASETIGKDWNEAQKEYHWLSNDVSSTSAVSPVNLALGAARYCTENTMDAFCQTWGFTTKAVVRAYYTPASLVTSDWETTQPSYFSWNGTYYTLDGLKTAFTTNAELKATLIDFLKRATILTKENPTNTEITDALIPEKFNAYTGIKARYSALRYYHQSMCYYDVLIRHDEGVNTLMGLGRYGVVRNNFYTLELQAVSEPGTPWIPDPTDPNPGNPTNPTDPDDNAVNMTVKVKVEPWTIVIRKVELN